MRLITISLASTMMLGACTIDMAQTFPSEGVFGDSDSITGGDATAGGDSKAVVVPPVTMLEATAGDKAVSLSWNLPSTGLIDGILVFSSTASVLPQPTDTPLATLGASATALVNDTLANDVTYYFTVFTFMGSEYSVGVTASATPNAPGAVPAISNLSATAEDAKVSLTWTAPSSGIGGILVIASNSGVNNDPTQLAGTTNVDLSAIATGHTFDGLTNGSLYYFDVYTWVDPGPRHSARVGTVATPDRQILVGDPCFTSGLTCDSGNASCVTLLTGVMRCSKRCAGGCPADEYCAPIAADGTAICWPQHGRDEICFGPNNNAEPCDTADAFCLDDTVTDIGQPTAKPSVRRCRLTCSTDTSNRCPETEQCLPNWGAAKKGVSCTTASSCSASAAACLPDKDSGYFCYAPGLDESGVCGTVAPTLQSLSQPDIDEQAAWADDTDPDSHHSLCNYGPANFCRRTSGDELIFCQETNAVLPPLKVSCTDDADCLLAGASTCNTSKLQCEISCSTHSECSMVGGYCTTGTCSVAAKACIALAESPTFERPLPCADGEPSGSVYYPSTHFPDASATCNAAATRGGCEAGLGCYDTSGGLMCGRPAQICLEGIQVSVQIDNAYLGQYSMALFDPIYKSPSPKGGSATSNQVSETLGPVGLGLWYQLLYWFDDDSDGVCQGNEVHTAPLSEALAAGDALQFTHPTGNSSGTLEMCAWLGASN